MVFTGEFLESQVVSTDCLRLFVGVRDHLEVPLVIHAQLVVVFDAWWELHASRHIIELDFFSSIADDILGDVDIVRAIENLDDLVAESAAIDDSELSNLINAIRPSVHAVRNI